VEGLWRDKSSGGSASTQPPQCRGLVRHFRAIAWGKTRINMVHLSFYAVDIGTMSIVSRQKDESIMIGDNIEVISHLRLSACA